jgi:hypothetical protein
MWNSLHGAQRRLTYNGLRIVQPILCAVQPILFFKNTVSRTEILVQHEIAPIMTLQPAWRLSAESRTL